MDGRQRKQLLKYMPPNPSSSGAMAQYMVVAAPCCCEQRDTHRRMQKFTGRIMRLRQDGVSLQEEKKYEELIYWHIDTRTRSIRRKRGRTNCTHYITITSLCPLWDKHIYRHTQTKRDSTTECPQEKNKDSTRCLSPAPAAHDDWVIIPWEQQYPLLYIYLYTYIYLFISLPSVHKTSGHMEPCECNRWADSQWRRWEHYTVPVPVCKQTITFKYSVKEQVLML